MQLRALATLPTGATPTGFAASDGSVWIALRSASPARHGSLVRLDAATGSVGSRLAVGAIPTALAARGGRVWVGNGSIPGPSASLGSGTVLEVAAAPDGRLRVGARLRVPGPLAIATTGSAAWIVSSASKTATPVRIEVATPSGIRVVGGLDATVADETTGAGPDEVVCGGRASVAATSRGRTEVASFDGSGRLAELLKLGRGGGGTATLVCVGGAGLAVVVSSPRDGGIVCVRPSATCTARRFGSRTLASAVPWRGSVVAASGRRLERYDPRTGRLLERGAVPRPGAVFLAADGDRAYVLDDRTIYRLLP